MDLVSYNNYQIILHRTHEKCTDLSTNLSNAKQLLSSDEINLSDACVDFYEITVRRKQPLLNVPVFLSLKDFIVGLQNYE